MKKNAVPKTSKSRLYFYVAAVVFIWATGYTLMGYTVAKGFPPAWIPLARVGLPALAITAFVYLRGLRLPKMTDSRWLWYGLMGFLGMTAPFFLQGKGQQTVESGISSILINGGMPLMTIVLAHFFVRSEPLSLRKFTGFIIGFIGVVFLYLPEDLSLDLVREWKGQTFILSVALSYALAAIVAKRAPKTPASVGAAIMLLTALASAFVIAAFSGLPKGEIPGGVILALFALSVFYTGLSDILYLKVISLSGPSMIAKINYLVPVFALIFGIVFLGEAFSWRAVAAMMIIITGLLISRLDENPVDEKAPPNS